MIITNIKMIRVSQRITIYNKFNRCIFEAYYNRNFERIDNLDEFLKIFKHGVEIRIMEAVTENYKSNLNNEPYERFIKELNIKRGEISVSIVDAKRVEVKSSDY